MKLTKIILEQEDDLFVPRRSQEERNKTRIVVMNRKIQEYIKNGSENDLDLNDAPFTSLPKELTYVGADLLLFNSAITELPENLKIENSLYLYGSPITSLPKGLQVGNAIDLTLTKIQSLPEGFKVKGNLYLSGTPITSLPEGLEVGGHLDLVDTPLKSLPKGLKVKRYINLFTSLIESLPKDIKVGGALYIGSTPLSEKYTVNEIQEMYPGIRGRVVAR